MLQNSSNLFEEKNYFAASPFAIGTVFQHI